jgi:signal peptidase I
LLAVVAEKLQSLKFSRTSLGPCSKRYVYPFLFFVFAFLMGCDDADIRRHSNRMFGIRTFRIPSTTMEPTLKVGDYFIAGVEPYKTETPRRGDLVVFPFPEDRSKDFVKRLIGLGGEKLEIRNKQVFINSNPIDEPYKHHADPMVLPRKPIPRDNFGPITIPEGSVFVMGDNRDWSYDSRFFGLVPVADLDSKPLYIYWGDDISRIGARLW